MRKGLYKCDVPPRGLTDETTTDARTGEPLLWLAGAGHEHWRAGAYYHDAATRNDPDHVVLQLTLSGVGFYRRGHGPRVLLPPGRAFIDRIPGPFEYGGTDRALELVFVSFAGPTARQWMNEVHRQHGPTLDLGTDTSVAQTMLGLIDVRRRHVPHDRYLVSGQLYGLLMQLMSVLFRKRLAATPLVAQSLRLIREGAKDVSLNVNQLAAGLSRSREHLTREFTDAIGVSPSTYLTQTRVRLAAAALRAGEDKLQVVARQSGFASSEYLCRVFRKTVGVTPVQFRQRPWMVAP